MIGQHCLVVLLSLLCCGTLQGSEAQTTCNTAADVVFVLDSSGSIGATNWPNTLKFVNNVVRNFVVNVNATMFGVVTYADKASVSLYLSGNQNYITSTVNLIPYQNLNTNTSGGIWAAKSKVFTAANGARSYAPDVMILVTDGQSNRDTAYTIPYAVDVRKSGIALIVVGVGNGVNTAEVNGMASTINGVLQVYRVADYPALSATVQSDKISNVTCTIAKAKPNCTNGGQAVLGTDAQYTCSCPAGFYGPLCEKAKPQCQNGGQAVLASDGSYKCSCPSGFYGDLCEKAVPKCQNGGQAVLASDGSYKCSCPAGFYGDLCEKAKPNCKNGGQAVLASDGSYKCSCPNGFYGDLCEKAQPKCQNGGQAVLASDGSYKCSCPAGFYGDLCDKAKPNCQNGGQAVLASDGSYKCSCPNGFYGDLCEKAIPQCKNGGTAVKGADGSYTCNCPANFYGPTCESVHCLNGGSYVDGKCACGPQFYGDRCEKSPPPGYVVLKDDKNQAVTLASAGKTADTWDNLSKQCGAKNAGATLAVVDTAAKDAAFKKYILSLSGDDYSDCGGQFATAGIRNPVGSCVPANNFVWKPDGKPSIPIVQGQSFTGWMYDQPDCGDFDGEKENCIAYWNAGDEIGWNDYRCNGNPACPLCELPL